MTRIGKIFRFLPIGKSTDTERLFKMCIRDRDMYGEKQVYGQTLNPSLDNGAKPADLTNTRQEDAMVSYLSLIHI